MTIPPSVGKPRSREAGRFVLNGHPWPDCSSVKLRDHLQVKFCWRLRAESKGLRWWGQAPPPSLSGALACACLFPGSSSRLGVNIWGGWVGSRMMQTSRAAMGSLREGLQAPRMPFLLGNLLPSAPTSATSQALVPASNLLLRISGNPPPHLLCPLDLHQSRLGPPHLCSETCSSSPGPSEMPQPTWHPPDSASPSVNWG